MASEGDAPDARAGPHSPQAAALQPVPPPLHVPPPRQASQQLQLQQQLAGGAEGPAPGPAGNPMGGSPMGGSPQVRLLAKSAAAGHAAAPQSSAAVIAAAAVAAAQQLGPGTPAVAAPGPPAVLGRLPYPLPQPAAFPPASAAGTAAAAAVRYHQLQQQQPQYPQQQQQAPQYLPPPLHHPHDYLQGLAASTPQHSMAAQPQQAQRAGSNPGDLLCQLSRELPPPSLHSASRQSLHDSERGLVPGSPSTANKDNKALYLGNLHPFVTEEVLHEVFAGCGGIAELKVIRDKNCNISAGYGFAKFTDHDSAAAALAQVNKVVLFGQEVRVNWAFQKELRVEAASHVHVFVGDLASDTTDAMLYQAFENLPGCSDARVMWDHGTGRSRGYGFVSFRTREEAEAAIQAMHGHFVGAKRVRCGWAQHKTDSISPMDPQILDRADPTNTNVYVGNLDSRLTEANVKRHFSAFGPVAEVKLHRKGAYGFVRYENHEDAVRAMVCMNGQVMNGKQLKCSWGRHPNTPPQGVQTSLMALAAASMGAQLVAQPSGALSPTLGPAALGSPQALHMGMHLGMPMAGAAAQPLIQGPQAGGPVSMVATAGLLTAEGDLPNALHPLPMDPSLFYGGMFYGGQQLR